jgi:hypothetical protein
MEVHHIGSSRMAGQGDALPGFYILPYTYQNAHLFEMRIESYGAVLMLYHDMVMVCSSSVVARD